MSHSFLLRTTCLSQIIKIADSWSVVSHDYERSQTDTVTGCGVCLPLTLSIRQLMQSSCVFDFEISTPDILLLITTADVIIIELRFSYDIDCWNHALASHCVSIVNTKLVLLEGCIISWKRGWSVNWQHSQITLRLAILEFPNNFKICFISEVSGFSCCYLLYNLKKVFNV